MLGQYPEHRQNRNVDCTILALLSFTDLDQNFYSERLAHVVWALKGRLWPKHRTNRLGGPLLLLKYRDPMRPPVYVPKPQRLSWRTGQVI